MTPLCAASRHTPLQAPPASVGRAPRQLHADTAVHRPVARATERAGVPQWIDASLIGAVPLLRAAETMRVQLEHALAAKLGSDGYASLTHETKALLDDALSTLLPRSNAQLALDAPRENLREIKPHLWGYHSLFHERAWVLESLHAALSKGRKVLLSTGLASRLVAGVLVTHHESPKLNAERRVALAHACFKRPAAADRRCTRCRSPARCSRLCSSGLKPNDIKAVR